jgi:NAD(P)H dehydrogenase (quinone)
VIAEEGHAGKVYELAGDHGWTLSELAAELSKQSGKPVAYQNLSEADFAAALKGLVCLPGWRICWRTPTWVRQRRPV